MSVLENFKNIPRSPYRGRQGSNVIFFSSNLQRSPWRKKKRGPVARWGGDRPLSPTPGATIQWALQGGRSPLLRATGSGRLYKASPSFPPLI